MAAFAFVPGRYHGRACGKACIRRDRRLHGRPQVPGKVGPVPARPYVLRQSSRPAVSVVSPSNPAYAAHGRPHVPDKGVGLPARPHVLWQTLCPAVSVVPRVTHHGKATCRNHARIQFARAPVRKNPAFGGFTSERRGVFFILFVIPQEKLELGITSPRQPRG